MVSLETISSTAAQSADEQTKSMPKCNISATSATPKTITKLNFIVGFTATMLGSALPAGHNLGVINTPQKEIRDWFQKSILVQYESDLSSFQNNFLWGLVVSVFIGGAFIGSSTGAVLAEKYGRKMSFLIVHLMCLISGILICCCQFINKVEFLFVGRFLAGLAAGSSMCLTPLYLSEMVEPSRRGTMGTLFPLGLTSGILISQILGLPFFLGRPNTWAILVGGHAAYAFLALTLQPFIPETKIFLKTGNYDEPNDEHKEMKLSSQGIEEEKMSLFDKEINEVEEKSFKEVFRDEELRKSVVCIIVLNLGQQLAGINAVFFYSTLVFMEAGLGELESQYASIGPGIANVLMAAIAVSLVGRQRRKLLLTVSISLYATCLCVQFLSLYYYKDNPWTIWLAFFSLFAAVLTYGFGLGPVPYMIGTELFPEDSRRVGLSLGSMSNWAANLLIAISFPALQESLGLFSTIIFISFCLVLLAFVNMYVPETFEKPAYVSKIIAKPVNI